MDAKRGRAMVDRALRHRTLNVTLGKVVTLNGVFCVKDRNSN
jgi:hypothetical protein